ncbi:MAG: hypothetical protein ACRCS8_02400 [Brevinema sp.]
MENFIPPAMDEVKKKQEKAKQSLNIIVILSMIVVVFVTISTYYKIKSKPKVLTIQDRHSFLINYYNALVINDTATLAMMAPSVQHEQNPLFGTERQYSIYVFDSNSNNKNEIEFQVTDHHINAEKIYVNRAIFSDKSDNTILEIKPLGTGRKIN